MDSQLSRRPLHQKKEPLRLLLETPKSTAMITTAQKTMISISPPGFLNCSEEASGLYGATTVTVGLPKLGVAPKRDLSPTLRLSRPSSTHPA